MILNVDWWPHPVAISSAVMPWSLNSWRGDYHLLSIQVAHSIHNSTALLTPSPVLQWAGLSRGSHDPTSPCPPRFQSLLRASMLDIANINEEHWSSLSSLLPWKMSTHLTVRLLRNWIPLWIALAVGSILPTAWIDNKCLLITKQQPKTLRLAFTKYCAGSDLQSLSSCFSPCHPLPVGLFF